MPKKKPVATRTKKDLADMPGGRPKSRRSDPMLKSMLLGLIEDSYLHTGTFSQFAAEVLKVIAYAVTVPVAFTEGFLKSYLSIERVEEMDDGRIVIIPKMGVSIEDMMKDVDEIVAKVDPGAVFNPVVRSKLTAVHETSSKAMKYDLNNLSRMNDEQLMEVLREMQAESERIKEEGPVEDPATDYLRAKLATIRKNVRSFQAQQHSGPAFVGGESAAAEVLDNIQEVPVDESADGATTDAPAAGKLAADALAADAAAAATDAGDAKPATLEAVQGEGQKKAPTRRGTDPFETI